MCMSCDVEIAKEEELNQLEQILQTLDGYGINGTFFFLLSSQNYQILEDSDVLAHFDKNEFGLHIHWGQDNWMKRDSRTCLASLSLEVLQEEIENCLAYCRKLGFKPKSFRGGGLSQTTLALNLINKYGFKVDSSVAPKLDEKQWCQKHTRVPYKSWYFPSRKGYDIPAKSEEERIGIMEIPVTRFIPSFSGWAPYTLTPTSPLFKMTINQWLFKSRWEKPLLITPIFHSWGGRGKNFVTFLRMLKGSAEYLLRKKFSPLVMSEVYELLSPRMLHCVY